MHGAAELGSCTFWGTHRHYSESLLLGGGAFERRLRCHHLLLHHPVARLSSSYVGCAQFLCSGLFFPPLFFVNFFAQIHRRGCLGMVARDCFFSPPLPLQCRTKLNLVFFPPILLLLRLYSCFGATFIESKGIILVS